MIASTGAAVTAGNTAGTTVLGKAWLACALGEYAYRWTSWSPVVVATMMSSGRWFGGMQRRLSKVLCLAGREFAVADILASVYATVLALSGLL